MCPGRSGLLRQRLETGSDDHSSSLHSDCDLHMVCIPPIPFLLSKVINSGSSINTILVCDRFIPESARWLLDRGRIEEAKLLIARVAAINKHKVPESLLEKVYIYDCMRDSNALFLVWKCVFNDEF